MTKESPRIVFETQDFSVVYKPAGFLMHATAAKNKNCEDILTDWLINKYPELSLVGDDPQNRPGIVHRLDKETSGVVLVPRNQKTFEYFKNLFSAGGGSLPVRQAGSFGGQTKGIIKTYWTLVFGKIKNSEGVINMPIGIKDGSIKRSVHSTKMQKPAFTEYKVIRYLNINGQDYTFLEVKPKTGRTHQIRVHLAYIGHPVMGDKLYGGARTKMENLNRQFLHARAIEFTSPSGERLKFEVDLPADLNSLLASAQ